jgi:3-keto-disaccharide hydrolase
LRKVLRQSPTMGAKPPNGAIVLFDGSTTDHFPKAKMSEDKLLMVPAIGKQQFRDIELHVEFIVPYRCPSRGNSGVILQNCYEIQVLESFGADPSPSGCGGLYVVRAPDVNMSLPPLSWQTLDVIFAAARFDAEGKMVQRPVITVRHNGVLVHDQVTLPEKGNIGRPTAAGGPLHLQAHGSPVRYRNIWVVEKQ